MSDGNDPNKAFLEALPEIKPGEKFQFACHKNVRCFNACCADLNMVLSPYDVLRLRRALNMGSQEFMEKHCKLAHFPDTGFPALMLNMNYDEYSSCPFVSEEGCTLYEDRPAACRTYPIGRGASMDENGELQEQYYLVREEHCCGFEEQQEWTIETWITDQGIHAYNESNDRFMRLMAKAKRGGRPLQQNQQAIALLALFQLDGFLDYIKNARLLERVELSDEEKQAILEDDVRRLEFGIDWLEMAFFGGSERLKLKEKPTHE